MRRLRAWVWAGFLTAGVSAALLAGAGVANAESESDARPSQVTSQSTKADVTSADATDSDAKPHKLPRHGLLSGLRLKPTSDAVAQRSTSDATAQKSTSSREAQSTRRPLSLLRATLSSAVGTSKTDDATEASAARASTAQPTRSKGSPIAGLLKPFKKIASLAVDALQAVETVVTGPPTVPKTSTVTVKTSTLKLSNGTTVPANWYFPETDDGAPPKNMILLQHGFLAQGPMYSYTAATLAEQTNSVVVTPTLPSNPFAGDDRWMGSDAMAESIGDLFLDDRAELTASAVDAGYASAYGLDPDTAQLPQKFALEGHSLGANVVSGAAGHIVANGGGADLVGVILLDGVPIGDTLPKALVALDDYAEEPGGHYIPVRAIGAPGNLFNSTSTVNDDLTAARPDKFNGVVLDGGVHMDSMRGGNPLIQLAAYVVAGFPQPQNPPAVDQLSVTWLNEWFLSGDTGNDDDLVPGSTVDVETPQGTATGVVIGASQPNVLAAALSGLFPLFLSLLA